jgi:CRP-like cAMP-binding protein
MASFRFQMMEQNLQVLPTEKARKEYLKRTEKAVKDQFMDDLRNLTRSQGRILIKLIYRETGKTTYDLLQTYRGNFTAIYWQGLAKVFDANLKEEFNPVEDWQIEQIIKELGFE